MVSTKMARRRKRRTHIRSENVPGQKGDPKTFVFQRGKNLHVLKDLESDLRQVMSPNTARKLKVSNKNQLKDFVAIGGPLGVTHFVMLTSTPKANYLKIAKTPHGPTLTFAISSYSLISDVQKSHARPQAPLSWFNTSPLVVMNNMSGEEHFKLMTVLMQNMFPALKVDQMRLSQCKRVVLFNYDKESEIVSLRHYGINVAPTGLSKGVKSLVQRKDIPDLSGFNDISEFIFKSGYGSESEGEEAEQAKITLAQTLGRGNIQEHRSRVKLQEIGPRLELQLIKVQEGLCDGRVLYHRFIEKTPEEIALQQQEIEEKSKLKEQRRKKQEENVKKKQALQQAKEKLREEKLSKRKKKDGEEDEEDDRNEINRKKQWWEQEQEAYLEENGMKAVRTEQDDGDNDDIEQYRQEVGAEPDEEFMVGLRKKKRNWQVSKEYKAKKRKAVVDAKQHKEKKVKRL
eukprot:TRINITY_DN2214_c0_g1_i1.p1 TRINITY_DN2214_c0_g1~~TRINITY_DN2214_c0_g1_i1.p1  ORF type:complete len:457 (-),score=66.00 TRINITY_DN2214_c0_g1_i1:306-1676(-)